MTEDDYREIIEWLRRDAANAQNLGVIPSVKHLMIRAADAMEETLKYKREADDLWHQTHPESMGQ